MVAGGDSCITIGSCQENTETDKSEKEGPSLKKVNALETSDSAARVEECVTGAVSVCPLVTELSHTSMLTGISQAVNLS